MRWESFEWHMTSTKSVLQDAQLSDVLVSDAKIPWTKRRVLNRQREQGVRDQHDAASLARFDERVECS
jgi:hypothetical protein